MSRRVKVPMFQTARPIEIDAEATQGATFGRDLVWPDGTLVRIEDLIPTPGEDSVVYWRTIMEIPPNVTALADQPGTGIYVVTGAGSSAVRQLESDTLVIENPTGVGGNPKVDIPAFVLPAGEDIHGRRVVRAEDGEIFHPSISNPSHAAVCVGIAVQSSAPGGPTEVRQSGRMADSGWSWSPGQVYCGDDGVLTQAPPSTGWVLIVGRAISGTQIDIDLQLPIIRSN